MQYKGTPIGYYIAGIENNRYGPNIITINSLRHVVWPNYRRRGWDTASNRLRLFIFFELLELDTLWLDVFTDNIGAIRLYQRQGWQQEDRDPFPATALGKPLLNPQGEQRYLLKFWFTKKRYSETS